MLPKKISLENAKKNKLFYFVATVVVWRESDGRCLVLKRSENEKVHPGKYCVPGGKLEWEQFNLNKPTRINGDVPDFEGAIEELLAREVKEEAGISIEHDLKYVGSVAFVRPDGVPVVLVKFAARYRDGEVRLEPHAFTDYAWVNAKEAGTYDCILGIKEEVASVIRLFKERNDL